MDGLTERKREREGEQTFGTFRFGNHSLRDWFRSSNFELAKDLPPLDSYSILTGINRLIDNPTSTEQLNHKGLRLLKNVSRRM